MTIYVNWKIILPSFHCLTKSPSPVISCVRAAMLSVSSYHMPCLVAIHFHTQKAGPHLHVTSRKLFSSVVLKESDKLCIWKAEVGLFHWQFEKSQNHREVSRSNSQDFILYEICQRIVELINPNRDTVWRVEQNAAKKNMFLAVSQIERWPVWENHLNWLVGSCSSTEAASWISLGCWPLEQLLISSINKWADIWSDKVMSFTSFQLPWVLLVNTSRRFWIKLNSGMFPFFGFFHQSLWYHSRSTQEVQKIPQVFHSLVQSLRLRHRTPSDSLEFDLDTLKYPPMNPLVEKYV